MDLGKSVLNIQKEIKAVVSFGDKKEIITLNKRQFGFLKFFLSTGDFSTACQKAGIQESTASNWFRDSRFKAFVKERIEQAAAANGYNFNRWVDNLIEISEGRKRANAAQIEATKVLGKAFKYLKDDEKTGKFNIGDNAKLVIQFNNPKDTTPTAFSPEESGGHELQGPNSDGGAQVGKD